MDSKTTSALYTLTARIELDGDSVQRGAFFVRCRDWLPSTGRILLSPRSLMWYQTNLSKPLWATAVPHFNYQAVRRVMQDIHGYLLSQLSH